MAESQTASGLQGGAGGFAELLLASRFYMELTLDGGDDKVDATFLECAGFERSLEMAQLHEVAPEQWGDSKVGRVVQVQIPGNAKTENIVLKRGLTSSMTLWNWFAAVESGQWSKQCRDGSLVIYDQGGTEQARFNFTGAWPLRYKAADLSAQSTDMEIEELEMAVEALVRVKPN
ncbi:MAG: phage tail protein [Cyanobacteria bacterium P01_F01_bin.150]